MPISESISNLRLLAKPVASSRRQVGVIMWRARRRWAVIGGIVMLSGAVQTFSQDAAVGEAAVDSATEAPEAAGASEATEVPGVSEAPGAEAEERVKLTLPPNVEVRLLVDFVAERLGLNVLYGDEVSRARVTLRTPEAVPVSSLRGVLDAALQINGLALVEADPAGWLRVVPMQGLAGVSELAAGAPGDEPGELPAVETRIFEVEHTEPGRLEAVIRPFLTPQGANVVVDAPRGLLIVTDFASRVERAAALIKRLDVAVASPATAFVEVEHLPAPRLAQTLTQLLASRSRGGQAVGPAGVEVMADERSNRLVLIGPAEALDAARRMAEELDVDLGLETRAYPVRHVDPERLDGLVRRLIDPLAVDRLYMSTADAEGGLLVVSATPGLHARVAELREQVDVPLEASANPVRFYKLQNADAAEVLATIRAIDGGPGSRGLAGVDVGGLGNPPTAPSPGNTYPPNPSAEASLGVFAEAGLRGAVRTEDAVVTADENLNSIIVIADPSVQRVYETLIRQLDKRRPQVMVEVTIVTLDTTDGFSLGVDVLAGDDSGDNQSFLFSSFGFSEVTDAGRLGLVPGLGLNGALLQAGIADLVLRALKNESRAEVVSAPKILVNDNATGVIASVAEQPVTSINQGEVTATVTFSQYVDAGTSIAVTPQIAEGDHLRLEFEVALESFTGDSGVGGVPPPRQSNTITSEVTIPDGTTIVVGGINRKDTSDSISRVPLLGELPLLELLFSSRSVTESRSTLFVFIKPVILRDDRFADLRYLSGEAMDAANLPPDLPRSSPMLIQ